jgi:hypothetical protein
MSSVRVERTTPRREAGPVPTEAAEQIAFTEWLNAVEPQCPGMYATAIGHGGIPLPIRIAMKLKRMGLRAGMTDYLILYRGRAFLLEFKRRDGGQLSAAQKDAHRRITLAGGVVFVAKGAQAAIDFVTDNILATHNLGHMT